jgi:hypothetical protein
VIMRPVALRTSGDTEFSLGTCHHLTDTPCELQTARQIALPKDC